MSSNPEILLSCVHLFSLLGERTKSREFDKRFVERMRQSMENSPLDSSRQSGIK